jgi:hypothetical protein
VREELSQVRSVLQADAARLDIAAISGDARA